MTGPVEVRVEKRLRHRRERVFEAFLDPARVADWLFRTPDGVTQRVDYEPVVGGSFALFERRGGDLACHFGRFVVIERAERIVFDFWTEEEEEVAPTRVTVAFRDDGDGCVIVLTHDLAPAWAAWAERTTAGWAMILDSLETMIEVNR